MAATDIRIDPFRTFNFRVEIDGLAIASFSEVSGLDADRDAIDYREGADPTNTLRRLPGLSKFTNLVFKLGYVQDDSLWAWYQNIANGNNDRRNGAVILMNEAHQDVLAWNFINAWIGKIQGPSLNASENKVAIESMDLHHEGLTMEILSAAA